MPARRKKKYSNQNKKKGLVDVLRCYHRRLKYGSKLFHEAKILTRHLKVLTRTHTHACSSTRFFFPFLGGTCGCHGLQTVVTFLNAALEVRLE